MRSFRKRPRAEWRQAVDAWKESGLKVREFCRQRGLAEGRFYSWRKRFGFGSKTGGMTAAVRGLNKQPAVKFLPVQVKELPATGMDKRTSAPQQRIEIFMGNGAVVRVSGELSEDDMYRIMRLAAGAPC